MNIKSLLNFAIFLLFITACQPDKPSTQNQDPNPAAEGFNAAESDAKAIEIADEVMEAMGGKKAWDDTRYLTWNFFGVRKHWWDKATGDIRIEVARDSMVIVMNLETEIGKARKGNRIYTAEDSLDFFLDKAKQWWVNDSYWLFMPFKLKDTGVTLKYLREDTLISGQGADVLELTFKEVGFTPDNKYWIYVDQESKLVSQWAYFSKYDQEEPNFNIPWQDYKTYGALLLAGNRGQREVSEINVLDNVSASLFSDL